MRLRLASPFVAAAGRDSTDGGHVVYERDGRMVGRSWVKPRATGSATQVTVRDAYRQASVAFGGISEAERAGWAALAGQYRRVDSLGQVYSMGDKGTFAAVNVLRLLDGAAITDVAPAYVVEPSAMSVTGVSIVGGTCRVTWTHSSGSETAIIDPSEDGTPHDWTPVPGPAHWSAIDDGIREPEEPDTADVIRCFSMLLLGDRFRSFLAGVDTVSAVRVWAYGWSQPSGQTTCKVSKDGQVFTSDQVIVPAGGDWQWRSAFWDNLGWEIGGTLTLRTEFDRSASGAIYSNEIAAAYAEVTFEPVANQFYVVEGSMALPGVQRRARENEMRWVSRVLSDSIVGKMPSPQTLEVPVGDLSWPWQVGDRVRIRITSLSAGYVKGGVLAADAIIA